MASQPKPAVSLWITAERKRHGWKVEELSRRLIEAGYPAEVSTVRVWEAGRAPRSETITGLERLFGSIAPRETQQPTDMAALVAALDRQTVAIRDLVAEVREGRDRLSPEGVRVFVRALIAEGLIPLPEPLPEGFATEAEPQRQGAGQ